MTKSLLYKYLSCKFLMGIIKRKSLKAYWTTNPFVKSSIPGIITRNSFMAIEKFLHLEDNSGNFNGNSMYKV